MTLVATGRKGDKLTRTVGGVGVTTIAIRFPLQHRLRPEPSE
jgi:hypothetical protein